jgi:hypothetical protein
MKSPVWLTTGLLIITAGGIMTLSCSRKPEDPAWFQSTATGKSLDKSILLKQIAQTDDIFAIYRMRDEFRHRGESSRVVMDALEKQWKKLLENQQPSTEICPEADLVAFDFKAVGPGECRADFIIRTKKAFDKDYWLSLHGIVDGENHQFLSEARRKLGKNSEQWAFSPKPPTTSWPVGEDILISYTFPAQSISYKMSIFIYDRSVKKAGRHGNSVQLGWRSSITEYGLLSLIKSCDNLISLFKLKTEYQDLVKKSEIVRETFEKKSKLLLKGKKLLGHICPEADLIAFDYKKMDSGRYRADYLFKVKRPFRRDYKIGLYGVVDKSNLNLISEARRKAGKQSESWSFHPDPATSHWPAGEYVLVSQLIQAQPIPYKMHLILFDPTKRGARHGQRVDLGWRVDIGE